VSTNNGVLRTKKAMKQALISLLQEKELREITISEIMSRAEYSRATFYAHFQFKEDLLDEVFQELITGFSEAFRAPYANSKEPFDVKQLTASAVHVFDYIYRHETVFAILCKSSSLGFQERLGDVLKNIYTRDYDTLFPQMPPHINRELFVNHAVYTMLGMIDYWVESQFTYSAKYMTDQLIAIAKLQHLY